MKHKKKQKDGTVFGIIAFILFATFIIIGSVKGNVIFWCAMGLGIIFSLLFIAYFINQKQIEASGVIINAYVTDCEQMKTTSLNPLEESYRLTCEADDTRIYGTAEVYSEKYVPVGERIELYYNPVRQFVCPAEEIISSKADVVTLTAALISFTVAHAAYAVKKYEETLFVKENVPRLITGGFALCFLVMGIIFFWIAGKKKKKAVANHCYPAVLVRYSDRGNPHGNKYPVWRYRYNGQEAEYESLTEKKLWQSIGTRSKVYVHERDEVFEKSEVVDSFGYGVIYLVTGIVLVFVTLFFDFG